MMKTALVAGALLTAATLCQAATVTIGVATPNDADNGTKLSPTFGVKVNFDNLTPFSALASNTFASIGITSIASTNPADPLTVFPFSSQSAPNYVATADFMGGLIIKFAVPTNIVGIGVSESDGLNVQISALGASNNVLGTFSETVPTGGNTPDNAYYFLQDTTNAIQSVEVVSSGQFAVDDLQFAPEPISFSLAGAGLLLLGFIRFARSRA